MNIKNMIDQLIQDDIQTIKTELINGKTDYLKTILLHDYNGMLDLEVVEEFEKRTWETE